MDPTRPTPAVCIGTDVYGRVYNNNAPSDFVTSRGSDDGDTFQSSSSRELAALRFEIPKDDIPKVADSVTGKRLQTCRRRAAFDLEWPLTPSPESVPATPVSPCKRRATDLHDVTRPYLSGDFAAGNLPPAPNEANERRRARKYEPEIEQDIQSRKKLLAINIRRNKLPTAWDESSFTGVRYKDAVAGKAKGKDTLGARPPPHHQSRRVVGSPVYHINDGGGLEDVPAIQLEDRFRQGPTSHEVDQFIPGISIQDQERGVQNRTPDPFPGHPGCPTFQLPRKVKVGPQPDPSAMRLVAPEYLRFARLHERHAQMPAQTMSGEEMELYFDFEAAS